MNRIFAAAAFALGVSCSPHVAPDLTSRVHPLDFNAPYRAADYVFLKDAVGARSIVQLGESIHVTSEFPRARLRLIQYLHEEMGFDVLAFEGSLIDTWLAQEFIYRSNLPERDKASQAMRIAFFGLWQTDPMREVLEYVIRTQSTPHPLYLSDFDIQPGMSRANRGAAASLGAFLDALRVYDPSANAAEVDSWKTTLAPALNCDASAAGADVPVPLDAWINKTATTVAAQRPAMHAEALRLVPSFIRARLAHCQAVREANGSRRVYQAERDRLNAANAIELQSRVSQSHRILLWAHHSHVNHNATGKNTPSMGQHLLAAAPNSLYTIGLFAGGGSAYDAFRLDQPGILGFFPKPLRAIGDYGVESSLSRASDRDFFADFTAPGKLPDEWLQPSFGRAETSLKMPLILARDFNAAVFIQKVHPASLRLFPPWLSPLLTLGGFVMHPFVLGLLTALIVLKLGIWISRRRRKRLNFGHFPS